MKNIFLRNDGFSLIELLVSLAIISAIGSTIALNVLSLSNEKILFNQTKKMESVLRTVQQKAVGEEQGTSWGVKIFSQVGSDDKYETFYGASYDTGTVDDVHFLPGELQFSRPTGGNTIEIVFTQGTGATTSEYIDMEIVSNGVGSRLVVNNEGSVISIENGKGLVGYWKLDEGSGTTAIDWSGLKNNGVNTGATINQAGQVGKAYSFDGSNYVSIADSVDFDIGSPGFTYMAWVKPSSLEETYNMFMGHILPYFNIRSSGLIHLSMKAGGSQRSEFGDSTLTIDNWYHLTAVYDSGGYMSVYLNGNLDSSPAGPWTPASDYDSDFYIGKWRSNSTYPFRGLIDDVRVFDRALSDSEIKNIYNDTR